jgi:GTP cyclohydrolase IA
MEFDDPTEDATIGLLRDSPGVDEERVVAAMREIITAIGDDPDRPDLVATPQRIARMYQELFAGVNFDPRRILSESLEESHDEMVIIKDIPFYSLCEHHFLPFYGVAHVGYVPKGRVVGISKLARVVDAYAKRPQVQERLTSQVADTIQECLQPDGVAVVVEAEHLCMTMRGIKKPGSRVVTSAVRGSFRRSALTRAEFLSLVQGR